MDKINILLVTGVVTAEHTHRTTNENLRVLLESTGRFHVRITEEFDGCTSKTLDKYDAIFLNYDGKHMPYDKEYARFCPETEKAFIDFIASGKGLVIYHSSVWLEDNLPDVYKKIWGIYCKTSTGARRCPKDDFTMRLTPGTMFSKDQPEVCSIVGDDLFAGAVIEPGANVQVVAAVFDDLESYRVPYFPPPHHPVIIPEGKLENMNGVNTNQPVFWMNQYGNGRVFGTTLGHEIETLRRIPYLTILCRGTEWAASGKVTLGPPDRSGENRLKKWPYYK
jgi:type 1 glutamine amidotransferase